MNQPKADLGQLRDVLERVGAQLGQARSQAALPTAASAGEWEAALARMKVVNDQLEMFHKVRAIAFNPTTLSTFPAAAVREIRGLYQDFDTKHPTQPEGLDDE